MKHNSVLALAFGSVCTVLATLAVGGTVAIGAAPTGDATAVASRISSTTFLSVSGSQMRSVYPTALFELGAIARNTWCSPCLTPRKESSTNSP